MVVSLLCATMFRSHELWYLTNVSIIFNAPCLPPEWCVSSSSLDNGSIEVARWLSSLVPSCLDLVSCLSWSRSYYCNAPCCVCRDPMNIDTMSNWLLNYHVYVIYDLACPPLLVDTLAKWMLVTPRGSIYGRSWVQSPFNLGEWQQPLRLWMCCCY